MSLGSDRPDDIETGLVEALCRDDADAVDRLVDRYGERLYRLAVRVTGVSEEAEAATSDALRTAARRISMLGSASALGPWISQIAAAMAYARLCARRPNPREIALDDVLPSLDDGRHFRPMDDWSSRVDDRASQGELRRALTDAIDELPADYRTALVLHDVEGMASVDIAATLGITPAEVKSRVHRSRLFVRKRVSESLQPA